ncbi:MAG: methylated-DNA--[protein]-cysteine S-methyltransferase [Opitutales bacterium]
MPTTAQNRPNLRALIAPIVDAMLTELRVEYGFHQTPLGRCLLAKTDGAVCYLAFAEKGPESAYLKDLTSRWPEATLEENRHSTVRTIRRIFQETPSSDALELLVRGTAFRVEVWKALLDIPQGEVCTYSHVARSVGRPRAVRAVASAIGANSIAWLIPCHRVILSDGGLGGYRWGLDAKRACLNFERAESGIAL